MHIESMSATDIRKAAFGISVTLGHDYTGTEHVLLALFKESDSPGVRLLRKLGVTEETVKKEIFQLIGHPTNRRKKKLGITPTAKELLSATKRFDGPTDVAILVDLIVHREQSIAGNVLLKLGVNRKTLLSAQSKVLREETKQKMLTLRKALKRPKRFKGTARVNYTVASKK